MSLNEQPGLAFFLLNGPSKGLQQAAGGSHQPEKDGLKVFLYTTVNQHGNGTSPFSIGTWNPKQPFLNRCLVKQPFPM